MNRLSRVYQHTATMVRIFSISVAILFFAGIVFSGSAIAAEEVKQPEAKQPLPDTKPEMKQNEMKPADKASDKQPEKKADEKTAAPKGGKSSIIGADDKEPTVITSESLTTDNNAKTALFKGRVVARKGDKVLYADSMLVYYVQSKDGENSNIDKIEAAGHVKLVRNDRVITAGKAVYYAGEEERAVFTESPRATEGKNVLTGTKMTYYMKDDRSAVENSKVFIMEKDASKERRVKATDKDKNKK